MTFEVKKYGDPDSKKLLIQMTDDHDLELIENEVSYIRELTGGDDFCLKAVRVESWNHDLSPWPAPAVFGNEDFGDGAPETLAWIMREAVGESPESLSSDRLVFLGGYSLAGLFALWAGYQTDRFSGIAAASPSIWFPGFDEYMNSHTIHTGSVYLSLGDREERTRNQVMSAVGERIRKAHELLTGQGITCTLEWNRGNHFKDADLRTAKAFAWVMRNG